ncbi:6400_t:CDS:1, partial [Funneliformis geosporum]
KMKARQIKDIYGKFSEIFKEAFKKAIDNEDFNEELIQFHIDKNFIEKILLSEFKKHKD